LLKALDRILAVVGLVALSPLLVVVAGQASSGSETRPALHRFDGRMLALHSSRFRWSPNGASSGPHSGCRRVVPPYQADLR
jgi:hypothetical protein